MKSSQSIRRNRETIWPGHRLSDFQRFLTDMALPVLRQSRLRDLRPWLRQGGSEGIQNTAEMHMLVVGCHDMPSSIVIRNMYVYNCTHTHIYIILHIYIYTHILYRPYILHT